jgi:hypothetical protein
MFFGHPKFEDVQGIRHCEEPIFLLDCFVPRNDVVPSQLLIFNF